MAIKEVRIVACDRCPAKEEQPVGTTILPEGWKAAYLGPEPTEKYIAGTFKEFCPECSSVVAEAMRPVRWTRRPAQPTSVLLSDGEKE